MQVNLTAADLIAFEEDIAQCFLAKQIRAPVHLSGGNERQLIDIFGAHVDSDDWVLTTWRSHYHCLLKGVPPALLKHAILGGKSISLCFPGYKILSSAIVGGIAPLAIGLAEGLKRSDSSNRVVCFLGDMAAHSGIVFESMEYAAAHKLRILWVIEDNGKSVGTDTANVWGNRTPSFSGNHIHYHYTLTKPHVGIGQFVHF